MSVLSLSTAVLLLLQVNAPARAQPVTRSWDMTGMPRFELTADTPREAGDVRIGPNLTTTFIFDTPVQREGVVLEAREHFRQVSLSEDGLLLTLLPSGELPPGNRLKLTVRFADGASPTSKDFMLVVAPRAEPQVEVYRRPRPGDSFRQEAEQAEARFQLCQADLTRERLEHGLPRGLSGLLALKQMDKDGVRAREISKDLTLRPGEAFEVMRAVGYRAKGGEIETPVVRLAVDLELWNRGPLSWTPTHAQLVGRDGRWEVQVWPPGTIASGGSLRLLVEVELPGRVPPGPYLLVLWDENGHRTASLSGVTFP
ncbi:DUF2381 family protein [Archangium lipolyticum]|uniref:DUF2381 family protein n=1 Tax=Archangium lipolyticum TaxID=2970465 RepID=UPI002149C784|nr:DUF2381 family protein [Archangium lipolyticum]